MLPKHVRYQAALHPARPGCRHRRWFCSRRRNISYYTCVHLSTPFFNFSEKTSLPFLLPSPRSLAPMGRGQGGGLASPPPISAPNQLFELLRCFAWLIHDFAPSPMRALVFRSAYSASRNARASAAFAASIKAHCAVSSETLMLQVRCAHPPSTHRNAPSEHSGVPHGLLGSESTPCSLTPNAHAPGSLRSPSDAAPNQLFELLRCSAWLIFLISPPSECRLNRFKGSP